MIDIKKEMENMIYKIELLYLAERILLNEKLKKELERIK